MKKFAICLMALVLILTACNNSYQMPGGQKSVRLQTEQTPDNHGIRLIKAAKELKAGSMGTVTIQGKAGTLYKITSTYKVGDRTLTANQSKKAGKDGIVSWSWSIEKGTIPGIYPITVTGDDTTLLSSYTVK